MGLSPAAPLFSAHVHASRGGASVRWPSLEWACTGIFDVILTGCIGRLFLFDFCVLWRSKQSKFLSFREEVFFLRLNRKVFKCEI